MKKLNKFFAVLVALAMMATLCVSMAFAENTTPYATGPEAAKLTKYLQAGEGVDLPAATYSFHFAPDSSNPATVAAFDTELTFAASDKDANGDYIKTKTFAEIFTGKTFGAAGEYKFTVTENDPTYPSKTDNETLTKDNASYIVHLYVVNDGNGTKIDKVTVEENGTKVDPNPENPPATADEGKDKGFSFTNTYTKKLVDNNDEDNNGLINLSKAVDGNYADKTFEFPFELTYTLPQTSPNAAVKYKVLKDGATEKTAEEQTAENGKITVELGHGEKLIITEAPQGLKWSAKEKLNSVTVAQLQNATEYQAAVNGGEKAAKHADLATAETALSTTGDAAFVNYLSNDDVTPEGILISNLPYIALALVAIGGLVAYVVVRRRNADEA